MAEPILKWAGGKRQLLDELYQRFPTSFDVTADGYHEPFLGGGALFFDLEPTQGTVNDLNSRLHNFYQQVRDNPDALKRRMRDFREPEADPDPDEAYAAECDQYFYQQRELFNRRPRDKSFEPIAEAAQLLYLNRTCFNGMYRENSSGEYNVPVGRYANPIWERDDDIEAVSRVLNRLPDGTLLNKSFEYVTEYADAGDVVYFDPPYEPVSPTADFAEYSADGFGKEDQQALLAVATDLADAGVHVIISNSGVMYDFYDDAGFHVGVEGATRSINSDGDSRGEVEEIIATSVPPENRVDGRHDVLTPDRREGTNATLTEYS